MAENKNMEIDDEAMARATGGTGNDSTPKFKVGDRVHYELTNPVTGETMAVNGAIVSFEFVDEAGKWRYKVDLEPNSYNCTEVQALEDRLSYA